MVFNSPAPLCHKNQQVHDDRQESGSSNSVGLSCEVPQHAHLFIIVLVTTDEWMPGRLAGWLAGGSEGGMDRWMDGCDDDAADDTGAADVVMMTMVMMMCCRPCPVLWLSPHACFPERLRVFLSGEPRSLQTAFNRLSSQSMREEALNNAQPQDPPKPEAFQARLWLLRTARGRCRARTFGRGGFGFGFQCRAYVKLCEQVSVASAFLDSGFLESVDTVSFVPACVRASCGLLLHPSPQL